MQKNHLKKMFKLEGYILDKVEQCENRTLLRCHLQRRSMNYKGERSRRFSETRVRYLPHLMLEDQSVVLVVVQRRFYFPKHKTKRWEALPDVKPRKQTTNTFRLNTLRELKRDNYSGTGEKRDKSGMFASKLLDELPLKLKWKKGVVKVGLDGKSAKGQQMVHNITDLGGNEVIGVLPNLSQSDLKKELLETPEEDRLAIKEVCTDMDPFYINVAKKVYPNANIVIDHYHVIALALRQLSALRTNLQVLHRKKFQVKHLLMKASHKLTDEEFNKLQPCFEAFPEVKRAWKIIHQLRRVYWQNNWKKGCSQLRKTIWLCEQSEIFEMRSLAKTLRKHKKNILHYYISKTTNAYTEGTHTKFELIKRDHCGIKNIERFSKRLMFCFMPFTVITQIFAQSV